MQNPSANDLSPGLSHAAATEASSLLHSAWTSGSVLEELPAGCRPATREDGYFIQSIFAKRSASPIHGWKIAATSVEGQRHIGVDGPMAGRIFSERVVPDGGNIPFSPNRMAVAEVEFAFRMGNTLAPRDEPFVLDEVLDAVATVHAAIEVPDSRYVDFASVGAPQLIADNACGHFFVEGQATDTDWRDLDLSKHKASGKVEGRSEFQGVGSNVLGDPRLALLWLANELRMLGLPLEKGQIVTTGTCMAPLSVQPGDKVIADFGSLGKASVQFD